MENDDSPQVVKLEPEFLPVLPVAPVSLAIIDLPQTEEAQVQPEKNTQTVPDENAVVPAKPEKPIKSSKVCEYCDKGLLF